MSDWKYDYNMTAAENERQANMDKTPMPLDEIKRRQAINADFVKQWKRDAVLHEQYSLEGELAIQFKRVMPTKSGDIFHTEQTTLDECQEVHRRLAEKSNQNGK